jgi:hypothetical protein
MEGTRESAHQSTQERQLIHTQARIITWISLKVQAKPNTETIEKAEPTVQVATIQCLGMMGEEQVLTATSTVSVNRTTHQTLAMEVELIDMEIPEKATDVIIDLELEMDINHLLDRDTGHLPTTVDRVLTTGS